jgi:hypothetical protein
VTTRQLTILPPDTYELEVADAEVRDGPRSVYIQPTYRVASGRFAGCWVRAGVFALSERSRRYFFTNMLGLGLGVDYFRRNPTMRQIAEELVGRTVEARVGTKRWSGRMVNEIECGSIRLIRARAREEAPAGDAPEVLSGREFAEYVARGIDDLGEHLAEAT